MRPRLLLGAVLNAALTMASTAGAQGAVRWDVLPTPIFDVSGIAADGSVQFEHPRAATRTANGGVLVADAGPSTIRVFDAAGRLLRSVGRAGRGPREFPGMGGAAACGDSMIVWDPARTSIVGPSGEIARTVSVPSGGGPSMGPEFRCSPTVNIAYSPAYPSWAPTRVPGMSEMRTVVVWADGTGRILWQSDSLLGGEWLHARPGVYWRPLGPALHAALVGPSLAVAPSDSARIWIFTSDGKREVIRLPDQNRRAPTKAEYAIAARRIADRAPVALRENTEKNLLTYPLPAALPAFYGMWGDTEGFLWVRTSPPGASSTDLIVLKPGRGVVSRVTIGRDIEIQEIGKDHITGIYSDDSDEVHVAVLKLVRR